MVVNICRSTSALVGFTCVFVLMVNASPDSTGASEDNTAAGPTCNKSATDVEIFLQRALSQGNVSAIMHAMDKYALLEGHVLHACSALANLVSIGAEKKDAVASAGGTSRLLNAMARHQQSADIQAKSCFTLAVLADEDYQNKARIIEGKGINRVIDAMRGHTQDKGVQAECSRVLMSLAVGDDDNRAALVQQGALESLIQAMRLHRLHGGVLAQAWHARHCKHTYNDVDVDVLAVTHIWRRHAQQFALLLPAMS